MSCYVHVRINGNKELYLIRDLRRILLLYPGGEGEGGTAFLDDDWNTRGWIDGEDAIRVFEAMPEIVEYNKMMSWIYKDMTPEQIESLRTTREKSSSMHRTALTSRNE
jgi:hypothetical protein